MRFSVKHLTMGCLLAVFATSDIPIEAADTAAEIIHPGQVVAFDRSRGNCLSCHIIADGELPGNSGPPLLQMQSRFLDRDELRSQIWDAGNKNPNTVMPPYGRHTILTEQEIDLVVDFLLTL